PSRTFLFLSPLQLRRGRAEPPDTTTFMAYASWDDSLAFFPTPAWDHDAFARTSDRGARAKAVLMQRETFLELANGWSASRPASASALEALALGLELLGNPTALDSLRRARSLAGDEEERLRVGASEFWLRLKRALPRDTAGLRHARALSDTLLRDGRRAGPLSSTLAGRLAALAAMRGRTAEAAALARVAMGEVVPGPLAHSAPGLLAFSALGGPADSIHALTEQVAAVFENPESAPPGQAVWLGRPATLAFPDHRVDLHAGRGEAAEFDHTYRAVAAYWRGDRAEALRLLESIFAERTLLHIAPEAVTIDAAYTEAALLDRLRGTAEARTFLRRALDGARTLPSGSYDVARAGTLMRAMAFMAELEVRGGDPRMGRDWARAVAILWVGADPHFRAGLERVTTLAMDGH
ncbi:MAG TPA: hypothetical protein VLA36_02645, partial [Longimicrobiales bacterium]|nr:hypothetical protein [Longimicrobiales bacterium]